MKFMLRLSLVAGGLFILAACAPATPAPNLTQTAIFQTQAAEPSATPTASSTPTPFPTATPAPVEGRLFFDMNGSGLPDEASFNYDPARLTDERQPLGNDLLAAISAYVSAHPDLKTGDLVTIEEPGLSGYTVCVGSACDETDAEGRFTITDPGAGQSAHLEITDPNAGTPALEMRYINQWKGPVTVKAYPQDVDAATMAKLATIPACDADAAALVCKQDADTLLVRDQNLNDTAVIPLEKGIAISKTQPSEIGLMQGFLTLPFSYDTWSKIAIFLGYDHDPRTNRVISYDGKTLRCTPFSVACSGTDDGHIGTDYGLPSPSVIFASLPGDLETWTNQNGAGSRNLRIKNDLNIGGGNNFEIDCDHLSVYIIPTSVSDWNTQNFGHFYRGQILALSGHTGTEWDHLHTDTHFGTDLPSRQDAYLAGPRREKDAYGVLQPIPVSFEYERNGLWSVFNLPVFSFVAEQKQ